MPLGDLVARRPIAIRIVVVLARQDGAIHVRLAVRSGAATDVAPLVVQVLLAIVTGWRRCEHDAVGRIAANAEPHVVGLHAAIGREGAVWIDRPLLAVVRANVEPALN